MSYKESSILEQHYDPEKSPGNIRADKQTNSIIRQLLVDNKLMKNYGPKHFVSFLQCLNVPKCTIPKTKQLQNKLFYLWKIQFIYVNELEPLVEKPCQFVFIGEEVIEQPFVHHYATDKDSSLTLDNSSER